MQTALLRLAALLVANSHAKSFALGLVGVLGTYVTQWLSGQDFGPLWTPLLAAGLPVLANSLRKLLEGSTSDGDTPHDDTVDGSSLRPGGGTSLRSLLLFAFLCLPISGHCASPKAVIKGPRTAVPGEFLRYDFGSSTGMKGFRLEIDPKNDRYEQVRLLKAEKAAEVASFKGVYKLTLTVWDESDDSDVAEWIVAIADRSKALRAALVQWCGAKLARHLEEAVSQSLRPGYGVISTRSLPPNDSDFKHPKLLRRGGARGLLHAAEAENAKSGAILRHIFMMSTP